MTHMMIYRYYYIHHTPQIFLSHEGKDYTLIFAPFIITHLVNAIWQYLLQLVYRLNILLFGIPHSELKIFVHLPESSLSLFIQFFSFHFQLQLLPPFRKGTDQLLPHLFSSFTLNAHLPVYSYLKLHK